MQGVCIKKKLSTIKSCVTGKGVFLIKRCAKKHTFSKYKVCNPFERCVILYTYGYVLLHTLGV